MSQDGRGVGRHDLLREWLHQQAVGDLALLRERLQQTLEEQTPLAPRVDLLAVFVEGPVGLRRGARRVGARGRSLYKGGLARAAHGGGRRLSWSREHLSWSTAR